MRLIDADALKYEPVPKGDRNYRTYNLDDAYDDGYDDAFVDINNAPTIDAVPVVRCKYCKHYNAGFECLKEGYGIEYPQDWFCADGERRAEK